MRQTGVIIISIIIVVIVVVALVFGALMLGVKLPSGNTTTTQTTQTGCSSSGCVRKLPIRFLFNNLYTNHPITDSVTATIYRGTIRVDSTTTFGGLWDTTKADFQSGDSYSMFVTSGNSKFEFAFQVPLAQNLTQARFQMTLNMALIGSYAISILGPDGVTPITSGYNATSGICNEVTSCKATKQPTFTIILTNSADNTGFVSSFGRYEVVENNQPRHLAANTLILTDVGVGGPPKITVSGWSKVAQDQETSYYLSLPDHAVDKHRLPDGTLDMNAPGHYRITVNFDASQMAHGTSETITLQYTAYLDAYYYANNEGSLNSEAIQLASFSFTLEA